MMLAYLANGDLNMSNPSLSAHDLFPVMYEELRGMAAAILRGERDGHTLQPTALVHEVYLRLAREHGQRWDDRTEFIAAAANVLRRVLVDHARRRNAQKRDGSRSRARLWSATDVHSAWERALDLSDAIEELEAVDPRRARVVELRIFAGLSNPQIASHLGVARSTVANDWLAARAWLSRALSGADHVTP